MAKLLADEQFPVRIQDGLRRLGHDVTTVRHYDLDKAGDGKTDEEVLHIANLEGRAVLTLNKRHFRALHESRAISCHKGIVAYELTAEPPPTQAQRLHEILQEQLRRSQHLDQQFLLIAAARPH